MLKIDRKKLIRYSFSGLAVIVLAVAGFFVWNKPKATKADWWNDSWAYRKQIMLNGAKITADLTDFPVLISLTDSDLSDWAQEDGDDIVFTDNMGIKLSHEIEKYASTTGELVAWVKMPALLDGITTHIYMYYGNGGTDSQENMTGVWDENYVMVHHNEDTEDSTAYGNDGVNTGAAAYTGGKQNGAYDFNDAADNITVASSSSLNGMIDITLSAWVYWDGDGGGTAGRIIEHSDASGNQGWIFFRDSTDHLFFRDERWTSMGEWYNATVSLSAGQWYHVAAAYAATSSLDNPVLYINGSSVAAIRDSPPTGSLTAESVATTLGNSTLLDRNLDARLDEVRVSRYIRSAGWIATEYNNQSSTSTFYTVAGQETGPGPVGYWTFDEGYGSVAYDSTANRNDGTLNFGTSTIWQDEDMCVVGKCLSLDGYNDYSDSAHAGMDKDIGTLNMWVKYSGSILDNQYFFDSDTARHAYYISSDGTSIYMYNDSYQTKFNNALPSGNEWFYITFIWNKTGNVQKLYINGVEKTGVYQSGTWGSNNIGTNIHFGSKFDHSELWKGFMDEVKIYPYARTADQIRQDYAAGLAGIGTAHGVSAAFGSGSDKWMSDGLVGYWKMDEPVGTYDADLLYEDASDSSGNELTGGAVGNASTSAGKFGNAGIFDGTNDGIEINSSLVNVAGEVTVSTWFKARSCANSFMSIISNSLNGDNVNYALNFDSDCSAIRFIIGDGINEHLAIATYEINLIDSAWHHLSGVAKNNLVILYLDGRELSRANYSFTLGGGVGYLEFGQFNITGSYVNDYDGQIDEARIYNRALSPDEVRKLYEWAPGPLAHWQMDEKTGNTAYDSSASTTYTGGNDGQLGANTTVSSSSPVWTRGKYGSAVNFDGENDYIKLNSPVKLQITGAMTVSAWVKPHTISLGSAPDAQDVIVGTVTDNVSSGGDGGYSLFGEANATCFNRRIQGYNSRHFACYDFPLPTNEWSYLTGVDEGNGGIMKLYLNGIVVGTNTDSWIRAQILENQYIGASPENNAAQTDYNFDGLIDDVKIYNYARTPKQIMEDMHAGHPGPHPAVELKFEEGKDSTAYDSSGHGNNGSVVYGSSGTISYAAMWEMDGPYGYSMELDGTDDYVGLSDIFYSDEFSVCAWFKTDDPAIGIGKTIVAKRNSSGVTAGTSEWVLSLDDGTVGFASYDLSAGYSLLVGYKSPISTGVWYHVCAVQNGSGKTGYLYLNGIEDHSAVQANAMRDSSSLVQIGARTANDDTRYFDGRIDEVKLYSYALTIDDVKADYNRGKAVSMGSLGGPSSDPASSSNAYSHTYCVPGDTTACDPPFEWDLDERSGDYADEISGSSNYDGWLGGGTAAYMPGRARGKFGYALDFDGVDDYADIDDYSGLSITGPITISQWIKVGSFSNDMRMVNKRNGGSNSYQFGIWSGDTSATGTAYLAIDNGTAVLPVATTTVLQAGAWYFLAGTWDQTAIRVYVNGIESYDGAPLAGSMSDTADDLYFGCNTSCTEPFNGLIDQVRIYDYARTPAQIAWEFNRGKPVAHWRFDECQSVTAFDSAASWNGGASADGAIEHGSSDVVEHGKCASSSNTFWYNGRTGKYNSAAHFDGADDYIGLGTPDTLSNIDVKTISAWIKFDSWGENSNGRILQKEDAAVGGWGFFLDGGSSGLSYFNTFGTGLNKWILASTSLSVGSWYHVLLIYDRTDINNQPLIYVNGNPGEILQTTFASSGSAVDDYDQPAYIGNRNNYGVYDRAFDGLIDDLKVWNYALTAEQIKMEYNGGAVRFGD